MKRRSAVSRPRIVYGLVEAFREGGVPAAYERHSAALRSHRWYRAAWRVVDFILPLSGIAGVLTDLEIQIGVYGRAAGCQKVFDDLGFARTVSIAPEAPVALAQGPAVFYANHASLLTPALLWAVAPRSDLKIVTHSLLAGCGPNLAGGLIPVHPRSSDGWLRTLIDGPYQLAVRWAQNRFLQSQNIDGIKAANAVALGTASEHVMTGGSVLIAPDGGMPRVRRWFPGLGKLLLNLAGEAPRATIWLVPVSVRHAEDRRLYSAVSRNPLLRRRARRYRNLPVEIVFGEALTLDQAIAGGGSEPTGLVSYLQGRYEETFGRG